MTLEKKKMIENYSYRYQISYLLYANVAATNSREISIERKREMYIIHLYRKLRMSFLLLIECFSFPQYVTYINMLSEHLFIQILFKTFPENSLIFPGYYYSKLQIKKYFKDFCNFLK